MIRVLQEYIRPFTIWVCFMCYLLRLSLLFVHETAILHNRRDLFYACTWDHYTIKVFLCNETCRTVLVFLMYLENLTEKQMELGKVDGAPDGTFSESWLEKWVKLLMRHSWSNGWENKIYKADHYSMLIKIYIIGQLYVARATCTWEIGCKSKYT